MDDAMVERIAGRYTCVNCGDRISRYAEQTLKSKGVCNKCGNKEFKRRPDDNAEAMRTRLQVYYKDTSPLIGYYYAKRQLKVVDGMGFN